MTEYLLFKYRPSGPAVGLDPQDMLTIYSRKANPQEIPKIGEIVSLPTEELDMPTSNVKEQQGESEMRFKVVDRDYGILTEGSGGGDPAQGITLVVTNLDA